MFAFIANLPFNCNSQWTAKKGPCVVLQVVRMGREPRAEMCELLLWGLAQWHCSACFCFIVILGGQWGFTVVPFQRYHMSYFTRMGRNLKYKKKQSTWPKGCWNQWQLCYRFLLGLDETPDPTNLVSVKKQCCHLVVFCFLFFYLFPLQVLALPFMFFFLPFTCYWFSSCLLFTASSLFMSGILYRDAILFSACTALFSAFTTFK